MLNEVESYSDDGNFAIRVANQHHLSDALIYHLKGITSFITNIERVVTGKE